MGVIDEALKVKQTVMGKLMELLFHLPPPVRCDFLISIIASSIVVEGNPDKQTSIMNDLISTLRSRVLAMQEEYRTMVKVKCTLCGSEYPVPETEKDDVPICIKCKSGKTDTPETPSDKVVVSTDGNC